MKLIKSFLKQCIVALGYCIPRSATQPPFLCVITPVFDGCIESTIELIGDLQKQSDPSFVHILISNGPSAHFKATLNPILRADKRFIYHETPYEHVENGIDLQEDLGKRRNYAMTHWEAMRYIIIDADTQLANRHYIRSLHVAHDCIDKDIIMTQTRLEDEILPLFPLTIGHVDVTNITFSRKIAQLGAYPDDASQTFGSTSDLRFFHNINKPDNTCFMPIFGCIKDARTSYESVRDYYARTVSSGNDLA